MSEDRRVAIPPVPRANRTAPPGTKQSPPGTPDGPRSTADDPSDGKSRSTGLHRSGRVPRRSTDSAGAGASGAGTDAGPLATPPPADDWKRWPGFRADPEQFWLDARITQKNLPGNKRKRVVSKTGKERDRQVLETIARGRGRHLTGSEIGNRAALASGKTTLVRGALARNLRFVRGGRFLFVAYIQRAAQNGDIEAQSWMEVWNDLPLSYQKSTDLDSICEAADVRPDKMLGLVVSTAMRLGVDMGDLVANVMHPELVSRAVKSAMRIDGDYAGVAQKDREMLFQHQKFIPIPRETGVSISASVSAAAMASAQPSVPSFQESLRSAMDAHADVQRAISTTPINIENEEPPSTTEP
jgi:hypothetical protein